MAMMRRKLTENQIQELIKEKNGKYFHYTEIKEEQMDCLISILSGNNVLALMPTGTGKSLCFQLPALCFKGITIVVTPIIALMRDQVQKFRKMNLDVAEFIDATKSRKERHAIYQNALAGKYKIIFVSPERLKKEDFLEFSSRADIDFLAIDEAHCISLWGYDFRSSYLIILRFLKYLKKQPVIGAFTATATPVVCEDIKKLLGISKDVNQIIVEKERTNLIFSIKKCNHKATKTAALGKYLKSHRNQQKNIQPGIVFCSTTEDVEHVYSYLNDKGYKVAKYYASMKKDEKQREQNKFLLEKQADIMVATKAFGMGIDKEDIRFVIHYSLPNDLESYYQEAGRGGRDGNPADCLLLYFEEDIKTCKALINKTDNQFLGNPQVTKYRKQLAWYRLRKMTEYCELGQNTSSRTLQKYIIEYFKNANDVPQLSPNLDEDTLIKTWSEKIDTLYFNLTKIAGEIRKGDYQMGIPKTTDIGPNRGEYQRQALITYELLGQEDEKVTYFDMMVADAVYTLEENKVPIIYAKNVYQLLSGDENIMPQPEKKREIEESIDKMRRIQIRIDRSQSMFFGFSYEPENERIIQDRFLPLDKCDKNGYTYTRFSPLSRLATISNGQFAKIKLSLFHVLKENGEKLSSTTENIKLIYYLTSRINAMKRQRKLSRRILYYKRANEAGLQEILGINELEDKYSQKRKMDNIIGAEGRTPKKGKIDYILDYFVDQMWIKGYERILEDKKIRGVVILL